MTTSAYTLTGSKFPTPPRTLPVAPSRTRLVFAQFGGDAFIGDPDSRIAQILRLRPKLGGLLVLDRPAGFAGHTAGTEQAFAAAFGPCILEFATSPNPGSAC